MGSTVQVHLIVMGSTVHVHPIGTARYHYNVLSGRVRLKRPRCVSTFTDCTHFGDVIASVKVNTLICLVLVVAQLVEQSLPTPEDLGSKSAIGKLYRTFTYRKSCNKEKKMPGMNHH